jgi:hypothetical protein
MTELRDYILSKLHERIVQGKVDFPKTTIRGKAAREQAAKSLRDIKARYARSGLANAPGEPARATKEYIGRTYRLVGDPKPPKPEPQRSSTDLRTQLAYVLADKLEELKLPKGGIDRDAQGKAVRGKNYARDVRRAAFTAITGRQAPDEVGVGPGGVVDVGDSASRQNLPRFPKGSPELKKAGKHFQSKGPEQGLKRPPSEKSKPENASTDLRTQLMYILADKLDEIILPSFKVNTQEIEDRKTRGMKPFPTTQKPPPPSKEQLMQIAAKAAKKRMPSITDVDVRDYLPQPDLPKPGEGSKGPVISKKPDPTKGIRFK